MNDFRRTGATLLAILAPIARGRTPERVRDLPNTGPWATAELHEDDLLLLVETIGVALALTLIITAVFVRRW